LYSSSEALVANPIFSTSTGVQTLPTGVTRTATLYESIEVAVGSTDGTVGNQLLLLPMPAGTTVSAEGFGGTCAVDKQFGSPIPNINPTTNPFTDLRTGFSATLKNCFSGESVLIKVTSPGGAGVGSLITTTQFRFP
jgi:hypothetical protein